MTRSTARIMSLAVLLMLPAGGCETGAQTGGLVGAGIGALAGQAIGGDTEATLIGTAVGSGIGYIIGNEEDKQHARQMDRYQPQYRPTHHEVAPLGGTRWKLVSLVPRDIVPEYVSKIVEFEPNGRVITTTTYPDGNVQVDDETYRVVGTTLVINKPGYLINARFERTGDQLIVSAEEFSAVLSRI